MVTSIHIKSSRRSSKRFGMTTAAILAAAAMSIFATHAQAALIGGLDLVSNSSIFETSSITSLPAEGWDPVSSAPRVFDTGVINGSIINGLGLNYVNYEAEYRTAVAIQGNTQYTLHFDMGFVSNIRGGSADYLFQLGTITGAVFLPLATQAGTVADVGGSDPTDNLGQGVIAGFDDLVFNTGPAVSGDNLAVRWAQTGTTVGADFFGFDNVTLQAVPVPEPSTALLLWVAASAIGFRRLRPRRP